MAGEDLCSLLLWNVGWLSALCLYSPSLTSRTSPVVSTLRRYMMSEVFLASSKFQVFGPAGQQGWTTIQGKGARLPGAPKAFCALCLRCFLVIWVCLGIFTTYIIILILLSLLEFILSLNCVFSPWNQLTKKTWGQVIFEYDGFLGLCLSKFGSNKGQITHFCHAGLQAG